MYFIILNDIFIIINTFFEVVMTFLLFYVHKQIAHLLNAACISHHFDNTSSLIALLVVNVELGTWREQHL